GSTTSTTTSCSTPPHPPSSAPRTKTSPTAGSSAATATWCARWWSAATVSSSTAITTTATPSHCATARPSKPCSRRSALGRDLRNEKRSRPGALLREQRVHARVVEAVGQRRREVAIQPCLHRHLRRAVSVPEECRPGADPPH